MTFGGSGLPARWSPRRLRRLVALLVGLLVVTACGGTLSADRDPAGSPTALGTTPQVAPTGQPNIVLVLTDDLSRDLVPYLPHVLALKRVGTSFRNFTVTDTLCCPSRASLLTGLYPHDTHVFQNYGRDGGFWAFHDRGEEKRTFAVALQKAGYRTALMGKYLNGYRTRGQVDGQRNYVPPGWDEWNGVGNGYGEYDYWVNHNGRTTHRGDDAGDYLTDVLARDGARFIRSASAERRPFFLEVSTFAPHAPATPAPQDVHSMAGLRAPRGPAFDRVPRNAPSWLAGRPALGNAGRQQVDRVFRRRVEAVQAVDRLLGDLQAALTAAGQARNTVVVFTSDNGYHQGQYSLAPGKQTAFDTDVQVPLVVAGPGIAAGRVRNEPVQNIDLAPTFVTLAGGRPSAHVDGHSLTRLLRGRPPGRWRGASLVEHRGPVTDSGDPDLPISGSGNPPSYVAVRSRTYTYVEYATGEREFYDRVRDPYQLDNAYASLPSARRAWLHGLLVRMRTCHGARDCWVAAGGGPG